MTDMIYNKVYIIRGRNGEPWGDSYEWIVAIYLDKDKAQKRVDALNKKAKEDYEREHYYQYEYKIQEFEITD